VKHHGRLRALRTVEALGIDRELARAAVAEAFCEVDEAVVIEQVLERRLRFGASLDDPATLRRVQRYLLAQGFEAGSVAIALRRHRDHSA
jgi:SOS response regulatory protein OraA/RecX